MIKLLGASPSGLTDADTVLARNTAMNGVFVPADSGYKLANFDPAVTAGSGTAFASNGVLYVQRLRADVAMTITNLHYHVVTVGATLTASQNFVGLYTDAGALLSSSADQSTIWTSAGFKTTALGAAQAIAAGYYKIVFLSNGTTRPAMLRSASGSQAITGPLSSGSACRFSTAGSALTALPATLPAQTGSQVGYFVGAS